MKRSLVIVIILCFLITGCVTFSGVVSGLKNVLGKAGDMICSPTVDQVADAVAALSFIQVNSGMAAVTATAIATLLNIKNRICVSIPQLQQALTDFDTAAASLGARGAMKAPPPLTALRAAAGK